MKKIFCLAIILFLSKIIFTQNDYSIEIIHDGVNTSLRGLFVVNNQVIWASGSNGYVGRSIDGGATWSFKQLANYDSAEFRDIEAFDENIAIVMGSVQPACILKTIDGGNTWNEVFRDNRPEIFLDGMDFHGDKGVCLGDPVSNKFFLIYTRDKGETWITPEAAKLPSAEKGIAAFAASGTSIQFINGRRIKFGTGGENCGKLYSGKFDDANWKITDVLINDTNASSGIFSILFLSRWKGFVVGGDYERPDSREGTFANTHNGGKSWKTYLNSPLGYRSCIEKIDNKYLICCGTDGIDIAEIKSQIKWVKINNDGFNVVQHSKKGNVIFLAGNNGRIAKVKMK
ncbi:MAG: WD40/YVTN/BNR-like repeat-containing protein [Chitinophagales bacterium]